MLKEKLAGLQQKLSYLHGDKRASLTSIQLGRFWNRSNTFSLEALLENILPLQNIIDYFKELVPFRHGVKN